MRLSLSLLAVLWAGAMPAAAQVVTGRVVLPDSAPLAGGIVTAADTRGNTIGRTLTNQRGDFTLRLSAAGQVRLRVLRIGYWPTEGPTLILAENATERVRIVFISSAVALNALGVRERETCRVSADTGLMVARVWEEARKAMLTSQLGSESAPMFAEWIEYDRTLDSTTRLVREQKVRTSRSPTTHAFRSVPAEILRDSGFVLVDRSSTTYYAPDAEALLSDVFVSGHCFRLVESPRESANLIGVGFVPTRDRRDIREIEGILWVDRATAELRTLEFRYTNLPDATEPAKPGGVVEFRRVADGNWFVSRWNVRMPRLGPRRTSDDGMRQVLLSRTSLVLRAVQVTGGEVTRAVRGDSVVYRATGPSITVQVLSRDSLVSAAGATVTLDGTDYSGTADSLGRIRLSPVLAGRYRARIQTPLMSALEMPAIAHELETNNDARVDSLMLPNARDVVASACPRDSIRQGEGMLHGRVRDERARAIPGLVVTTTWKTNFTTISSRDGAHLAYSARTLEARTGSGGHWRVCGVPADMPLFVRVATDSGSDVQSVRLNDLALASVDLVLHPARTLLAQLDATKAPVTRALVEILVSDDRGVPLPDASLEVESRDSPVRSLVTGASGRALVPEVALGRVTVRARHIGMTPGHASVDVQSGSVTIPIVMASASTPTLDAMRVVGVNAKGRHDAFEARRLARQASVSITREEIEKRNPTDTWQMLTGTSSMTVSVRDYEVVATSKRQLISGFDMEPCFFRVAVDGILMSMAPDKMSFNLRDLPAPRDIHGIEVFNGPATIPVEFGGIGMGKWCGLIAIWTK